MSTVTDLLAELNIEATPGVTEGGLDMFEDETGLQLPESVRSLYTTCDGAVLNEGLLRILPLGGVLEHVIGFRDIGFPQRWGYFPFTDNNDSNPFCVCCTTPLAGYVVQVFHDDSAAIKFRSLDGFLAALREFVTEDEWDLYEMPSDFDGEARTAGDVKVGRKLLRLASELDDVEQGDAYRFGMWLLSGNEIGEIIPLLQAGDEYVRDDAMQRLAAIASPEAKQALRDAEEDMMRFVKQCAEALDQAGVYSKIINGTSLKAGPRRVGVNTKMFYSKRDEPRIFDRLVERFRAS